MLNALAFRANVDFLYIHPIRFTPCSSKPRNLRHVLAITCGAAGAVPFYWTDWTGADLDPGAGFQAQGTITTPTSTVTATYTNGNGIGFYQPSGGIDYYVGRGARDSSGGAALRHRSNASAVQSGERRSGTRHLGATRIQPRGIERL